MNAKILCLTCFILFITLSLLSVADTPPGICDWRGYIEIDGTMGNTSDVITSYTNNTAATNGTIYSGGYYIIHVPGNDSFNNVTFKVNGVYVNQSYQTWSCSSGYNILNLTMNKSTNGVNCTYASGCSGGYCVYGYCRNASTYCGDGYCDTGESCSADNSGCSSGYACTNGCVATSSGGTTGGSTTSGSTGGNTGGAVTPTITITLAIGKANITVPSIAAGNTTNVTITKTEDVAFRQINISVANSVNNIKLTISKLLSLPASVDHNINGKVYNYIQIDKTNFTDIDVSKVYIKFAVNKTWFTDNGVAISNISLYRWANSRWNELTTIFLSNDSYEVFYQAESPGFSYFLIGTKNGEAAVTTPVACVESWTCGAWSACTHGQLTRTCTDANSCGTFANKPSISQNCVVQGKVQADNTWMYYSAAAIIIIIIAVVLFIFRKKMIQKKQSGN